MNRETEILVALARIESTLSAHGEELSEIKDDVAKLKKTINGNGTPGLAEKVRNIEGKMALIAGAASTIVICAYTIFKDFVK